MTFVYKPNFKKRIFATLLDYLIFGLLCYLYIGFFGKVGEDGAWAVWDWMVLPLLILWCVYFVIIEGLKGATLGHQALNLKVLTARRDEIGMTDAFLRHLLDIVDIAWYGLPAIITIKYTEKHQRLGDLVAGTIVVDTEDEAQYKENADEPIFER